MPSSDLLRAVIYPDSDDTVSGGALSSGGDGVFDRYEYTYWADGSMKTMTDPRGVVHEYAYDALGRRTADAATSLGRTDQNVSGTVRMIGTAYGKPFPTWLKHRLGGPKGSGTYDRPTAGRRTSTVPSASSTVAFDESALATSPARFFRRF